MFVDDVKLLFETGGVKDLQTDTDSLSSWEVAMDIRFKSATFQQMYLDKSQDSQLFLLSSIGLREVIPRVPGTRDIGALVDESLFPWSKVIAAVNKATQLLYVITRSFSGLNFKLCSYSICQSAFRLELVLSVVMRINLKWYNV